MRIALSCVAAALATLPAAAETRIASDAYNNSGFVGYKTDDVGLSGNEQYARAAKWGVCVVERQPDLSIRYLTATGREAVAAYSGLSSTFSECRRSVGWTRKLQDSNVRRAAIGDALRARL